MSFEFEGWRESLAQSFPSAFEFLQKEEACQRPLPFYSEPVELPAQALSNLESLVKALFQLKKQKAYQASLPLPPQPLISEPLRQDSVLMGYDFHLSEQGPRLIELNTNASGFLLNHSRACFEGLIIPSNEDPLKSLQQAFESEWQKFKESQKFKKSSEENRKENREKDRGSDRGGPEARTSSLKGYREDRGEDRGELETRVGSLKGYREDKRSDRGSDKRLNRGENRGGPEELSPFSPQPTKTVLIDEEPFKQPMLLEFFMFKDFFELMGWPSFEICDSSSLKTDERGFLFTEKGERVDFVYNRTTDFYFERHPHLLKAFLMGTAAISPQPREYWLLADKGRLCDWFESAQKGKFKELKGVESMLPFSASLSLVDTEPAERREFFWKNRKKYFFKIQRGYGGKQVYRGSGLTRKTFNQIYSSGGMVQEYIPPSRLESKDGKSWKIDFRAYVYEDKIQQLCARAYQGQVTNFKAKGSGFAPVVLSHQ